MTIRVLLADDQAMIRASLRIILEDQPDITVVAEAGDGVEAIEQARRTRPDVCLVDIQMPRLDGIEVARALADAPPRVVMVTTFDLDEYVYGALRCGAAGFVLKDAGPILLVEAVRAAYAGDALISPAITLRLLRHLADRGARAEARMPARPLTARETETAKRAVDDCDRRMARYRTTLDAGADPQEIGRWMAETRAERLKAEGSLRAINRKKETTEKEIMELIPRLAEMTDVLKAADPAERNDLYEPSERVVVVKAYETGLVTAAKGSAAG